MNYLTEAQRNNIPAHWASIVLFIFVCDSVTSTYHIWWFYAGHMYRPCHHHKLQILLGPHASCPTALL